MFKFVSHSLDKMKLKSIAQIGLWLVFGIFSMSMISSCSDPCDDILCKNNGICRDGKCACAKGFDGPLCEYKMYEKFIGTWDGTYRCNGAIPVAHTIVIEPGTSPDEVKLYNLFNQNVSVIGKINGIDIQIEEQTVNDYKYSGHGYVNGDWIVLFMSEQSDTSANYYSCDFNGELYKN